MAKKEIVDITHVYVRGSSYRITVPRKVGEELGLVDGSLLSFVREDGKIFIENLLTYGEQ
jgi:bifunctional DNA-binding transcriptional regulator/antitoxin component of YhaV-PrlF toxin-antitoxin module